MTPTIEERAGSVFTEYADFTVEYRDSSHRYWLINGDERAPAVSVTSALKVLDKPALVSWAEACGAEGAAKLAKLGQLDDVAPDRAIFQVRRHNLGCDAKRDEGAKRGTSTHAVLESYARDRSLPPISAFPVEQRGFYQGLARWLLVARPVPQYIERVVGSARHGYAGRLDMRATIDGRDVIVDLKTSARGIVYPEAHLQAAAYALADEECGAPPADGIVIVAVGVDGSFEAVEGEASSQDWLSVLATHRTLGALRTSMRARQRMAERAAA
ncbi:MAG: hypothetical protein JWQ48_2409 [Conexibacter sp.]|nr:hypothetical protein [Conexibacter sp.]